GAGEQFSRAVPQLARPKGDLGFGEMRFEQRERPRGVTDVADVDALPGTAQQDLRRPLGLRTRGDDAGEGGSSGEELTSIHGLRVYRDGARCVRYPKRRESV